MKKQAQEEIEHASGIIDYIYHRSLDLNSKELLLLTTIDGKSSVSSYLADRLFEFIVVFIYFGLFISLLSFKFFIFILLHRRSGSGYLL